MAAPPARVKLYSSAIPVGTWSGLVLVAIAAAIMWAVPEARLIVGTGLVVGAALAAVLMVLHRRSRPGGDSPVRAAAPARLIQGSTRRAPKRGGLEGRDVSEAGRQPCA